MSNDYPPPPEQPGYQGMGAMPAPGQPSTGAPAQPSSIKQAVQLMRVGALLSLLGILVTFLTGDDIRKAVEEASAKAATPMTPDQIDTAVSVGTGFAVVMGLLSAGLWLWMASANGKGRSWARIVATVLFGLSLLSLAGSLAQGATSALAIVVTVVSLLVGAYVLFLLWKKESTAFYTASCAPRV